MTKLCDLSETARKAFVVEVSWLLKHRYHVDEESIGELWDTLQIGTEARRRS